MAIEIVNDIDWFLSVKKINIDILIWYWELHEILNNLASEILKGVHVRLTSLIETVMKWKKKKMTS